MAGRDLALGYRRSSWFLDVVDNRDLYFYFDSEGDGDYSNEKPVALETKDRVTWAAEVFTSAILYDRTRVPLRFRIEISRGRVSVSGLNRRQGVLRLQGRTASLAVIGSWGYYGTPASQIALDVNGDGSYADTSAGQEVFYGRDRIISWGAQRFRFYVERTGDQVRLVATNATGTEKLRKGSYVAPFEVTTVDGRRRRVTPTLAPLLLLDFWSVHCAPCVAALPTIERLRHKIDVISISPDDLDDIVDFLKRNAVPWDISRAEFENPIYTKFSVEKFPTYMVIDRQNRLVCISCTLDDVALLLE